MARAAARASSVTATGDAKAAAHGRSGGSARLSARREREGKRGGGAPHRELAGAGEDDGERRRRRPGNDGERRTAGDRDTLRERGVRGGEGVHGEREPWLTVAAMERLTGARRMAATVWCGGDPSGG
uniref:Uncharacterized protein n=1 Tax=Oryza sativa subsp. japonica TaxID=39947 RepID=Q84MU2_ORYSJ|nr:hypothetical protein [Oryza sativa Japonica Group]